MTRARVSVAFLAVSLVSVAAFAEVVYLNNGDVVHGTLVAANNTEVTLKTPYGQLVIPKQDISRIDYQGGEGAAAPAAPPAAPAPAAAPTPSANVKGGRGLLEFQILGRSFWYAFESTPEAPADTGIRLRLYVGSARACTFLDEKPDTVDGATLYNSFTFSPTDAQLLENLEGFDCSIAKAEDGAVVLRVGLPPDASTGRPVVRMLYEVNTGTREVPRYVDAVSRSFSVEVAPGKRAVALLEQNADALQYSGFFKKQMKNVDQFQLNVLSTELKD
jgi:hypothetical protein